MSEKRKPETVLWVRHSSGRSKKVELFNGKNFPTQAFDNAIGEPIPINNLMHYYRMRIDGLWWPYNHRRMFSQNQCLELIKKAVFNETCGCGSDAHA